MTTVFWTSSDGDDNGCILDVVGWDGDCIFDVFGWRGARRQLYFRRLRMEMTTTVLSTSSDGKEHVDDGIFDVFDLGIPTGTNIGEDMAVMAAP